MLILKYNDVISEIDNKIVFNFLQIFNSNYFIFKLYVECKINFAFI